MNARLSQFILVCSFLAGCSNAVRVYRSQPTTTNNGVEQMKGIPFYVKKGVCKQETVWLEPQYTITDDAEPAKPEKMLDRESYLVVQNGAQAHNENFWKWVSEMHPPVRAKEEGGNDVANNFVVDITYQIQHGNWSLVSNTGTVMTVVDYSQVYYLNTARPLAGTTQLSYKLAADGTLTEGSAQLNDQTLATVASVISSLTTDAVSFVGAVASLTSGGLEKFPIRVRFYKHTHTTYVPLDQTGSCSIATGGVLGGSFTVSEETDSSTKPKANNDNSIGFSGSVTLPKGLAPAAPPKPTPAPAETPDIAPAPTPLVPPSPNRPIREKGVASVPPAQKPTQ